MRYDLTFPGLKRRPNKDGSERLVWVSRADAVRAGYTPKTVRLPPSYRPDDAGDATLASALCHKLQAEMLEWSSGRKRDLNRFDGTIRSLSRRYQADEASPFNKRLKHTTREKDLYVLKTIEAAFGERAIGALNLADLWRWYDAAKAPKAPGKPERVRRAWGIMKKLRELFSYGVSAELPGCARVKTILAEVQFPQPAQRRVTLPPRLGLHREGDRG